MDSKNINNFQNNNLENNNLPSNNLINSRENLILELKKDMKNNIDAIYHLVVDDYKIEFIGNSFVLYNKPDQIVYVSCRTNLDKDKTLEFLQHLEEVLGFDNLYICSKTNILNKDLKNMFSLKCICEAVNCYVPDDLKIFPNLNDRLKIKKLTLDDLPYLVENYNASDIYLEERLKFGMLGAFYDSKLCGFIGTHDDGEMGLLYVDPNYRKLGIGTALGNELILELRKKHIPIYGQIEISNEVSFKMHSELGYKIGTQTLYWFSK